MVSWREGISWMDRRGSDGWSWREVIRWMDRRGGKFGGKGSGRGRVDRRGVSRKVSKGESIIGRD